MRYGEIKRKTAETDITLQLNMNLKRLLKETIEIYNVGLLKNEDVNISKVKGGERYGQR